MSDLVLILKVRSSNEKEKRASLYFDTGSPYTFVREDLSKFLGGGVRLKKRSGFSSITGDKFYSHYVIEIFVEIKKVFCKHLAYIVKKEILEDEVLIGHDFMERFNIRLDPKKRKIIVDKRSLIRAQKIY